MDFYQISTKITQKPKKGKVIEVYPDFKACRSKDLMFRGKSFYAIWDEENQIWSTDEFDIQRLIDKELEDYVKTLRKKGIRDKIHIKRMMLFSTNMWKNYRSFIREMSDSSVQLDNHITFQNTKVKKTDYVSKRVPYSLEEGSIKAYDELMSTLYEPDERRKLEWAIGAIISGDARTIQKFIVLYGEAGSGKSTFLNIVQKLFEGYYTTFEAKALTVANNSFSTEPFKANPLVAIQHDGDLSKIDDNTKLNSIIAHEEMTMNEKYRPSYTARSNAFLFMGTNKPVRITDAKSGIIRRLIDVRPSGNKIPTKRYFTLMNQIDFELGAIAWHCLEVYKSMGKNYYSSYRPLEMIFQTDVFFNFVEANYHIFKEQDAVSLKQAYELYKVYCEEALIEFKLPRHKFREELKSYFKEFKDYVRIDDKQYRSYYSGFLAYKFTVKEQEEKEVPYSLVLDSKESLIDILLADCPAQYVNEKETPEKRWSQVTTKLSDINTKKLHYVRPPSNHIVIDFDLKSEDGKKSVEKNIEEASKWPTTYAEFSKSGGGIHLHYIYDGDVTRLSRIYSENIEVKVFTGHASLRRKLSLCNTSPVATITSGLPLKGEKMISFKGVENEKHIRALIKQNLNKEIHSGTKPSIDFIHKILEDAYKSDMKYDVTDLRPSILAFANNSTNQADYCIKLVSKMKFASETTSVPVNKYQDDELIFFDVEVFPNLLVVCWKAPGKSVVKMINPTAQEIEDLFHFKLVGFNCRRYDNHILYGRYIGYNNIQLFELSQRIIKGSKNAMFGEAYNISYTDVYDFASAKNKMGLKKWQIKLGLHHLELGLPWEKEVPEDLWDTVADYCGNDVLSTEAVFDHLSGDWAARQILSELSGLSLNDTTNNHTQKIVFGNDRDTKSKLVYTDLSEMFPGYIFENGKSIYRDIVVGEGGRVYAEPGMHVDVAVLDVTSMHPFSAINLNLFGPYTKRFEDLVNGRVFIKHKDYDSLKKLLDGKLIPFIEDAMGDNPKYSMKDISNGLKTAIVSVYGLSFARFDNLFRDPRNIDNIVAKRGALFMVDLQLAVQAKGFTVAHIKTDSIKIPNATPEIIDFVMEFGKNYGYEFEHETTYEKMCLVNDAVYIAKTEDGEWEAVGAQFAHPYVFKTLFSKEPIIFEDLCETKSVTTALYLDMNEDLNDGEHEYRFVGRSGSFCPIKPGKGGGVLLREKDGKYNAAEGTKGYRWMESAMIKILKKEDDINKEYFNKMVDTAINDISKFGDFEWFVSESKGTPVMFVEQNPIGIDDLPPWCYTVDGEIFVTNECEGCRSFYVNQTGESCCQENSM